MLASARQGNMRSLVGAKYAATAQHKAAGPRKESSRCVIDQGLVRTVEAAAAMESVQESQRMPKQPLQIL